MGSRIETEAAPAAVGPYSQAVVADGVCYTAGQIAITPDGTDLTDRPIDEQTRQCLENLEGILTAAGGSLADVLKTTVYLEDIETYETVNEIYGAYFPGTPPARSAVGVSVLPKGAGVEIEAIARIE